MILNLSIDLEDMPPYELAELFRVLAYQAEDGGDLDYEGVSVEYNGKQRFNSYEELVE